MEDVHKHEFQIRNLGTRSVTLFPSRAQVVREVKAQLKPGANQITIVGLSPSIDKDSIKVEGTGSAIITDIAVESLPNREIFQDIYPESEDEENEPESDDEDEDATDSKDLATQEIQSKMAKLLVEQKHANETIASAEIRLSILDAAYKLPMIIISSVDPDGNRRNLDISASLDTYRIEREKVYLEVTDGAAKAREIGEELAKLTKEKDRLVRIAQKGQAKANKAKADARRVKEKENEKNTRKRNELAKEKARVRLEREKFWPKDVYVVKISLGTTNFTPISSRRSSVSSEFVTLATEVPEVAVEDQPMASCELALTYVTSSAYWSPCYDLVLSTSSPSTLCFDALLTNKTSETWSNCKVVLSTSQADLSGLSDRIPTLVPWRVRLTGQQYIVPSPGHQSNHITYSREEQSEKADWTSSQLVSAARYTQVPHPPAFGAGDTNTHHQKSTSSTGIFRPRQQQQAVNQRQQPVHQSFSLFANSNANASGASDTGKHGASTTKNLNGGGSVGGLFDGSGLFAPDTAAPSSLGTSDLQGLTYSMLGSSEVEEASRFCDETATHSITEEQPELDYQESSFEEAGFTSTYELPGAKTLTPSSTTSKQRIARVNFPSVAFSHTIVAKYKPVAYLRAKLRNGSKLALLKGPASLTLDNSFIGRIHLPRCSPGSSFDLNLGVDPSIRVAYPKPEVKRSQTGLFSNMDNHVFTRTITLSNTRSGDKVKAARITLLDQVPISEDERLRVAILLPQGLVLGGAGVAVGTPGRAGKEDGDWGSATAILEKGGLVSWDVKLNAGRNAKLVLEYECSFPSGEQAVNV